MLDYSIIDFNNVVIDSTNGTVIAGTFERLSKIKNNAVKIINLVTNVTDIVINGYPYVKPIITDDEITGYKLLIGDLVITINSDDTVTAQIQDTSRLLKFSDSAMVMIAEGLAEGTEYKLVPVAEGDGAVIDIVEVPPQPVGTMCTTTFTCLNENFDSQIEVTITPDDDIEGGMGDETHFICDIPVGTYSYVVTAQGYQAYSGDLTISQEDITTGTKTITFTLTAETPESQEE